MRERVSKENILWLSLSKGFKVLHSTEDAVRLSNGSLDLLVTKKSGCELQDHSTGAQLDINTRIKECLDSLVDGNPKTTKLKKKQMLFIF